VMLIVLQVAVEIPPFRLGLGMGAFVDLEIDQRGPWGRQGGLNSHLINLLSQAGKIHRFDVKNRTGQPNGLNSRCQLPIDELNR
jgi:hypothetical protein